MLQEVDWYITETLPFILKGFSLYSKKKMKKEVASHQIYSLTDKA